MAWKNRAGRQFSFIVINNELTHIEDGELLRLLISVVLGAVIAAGFVAGIFYYGMYQNQEPWIIISYPGVTLNEFIDQILPSSGAEFFLGGKDTNSELTFLGICIYLVWAVFFIFFVWAISFLWFRKYRKWSKKNVSLF
jgi:hypothetical protein